MRVLTVGGCTSCPPIALHGILAYSSALLVSSPKVSFSKVIRDAGILPQRPRVKGGVTEALVEKGHQEILGLIKPSPELPQMCTALHKLM